MGKPATDWFCRNGHHVDGAGHSCNCVFDDIYENKDWGCPHCGITGRDNFHLVLEWDDPDYWPNGDNDVKVSHTPLRHEDKEMKDHLGNKYFVQVPVYNVSKMFEDFDKQRSK